MQGGHVGHHRGAHVQPALVLGQLVRREVRGALADVGRIAQTGLGDGRDPGGHGGVARGGDLVRDARGGLGREDTGDDRAGGLLEQAARRAVVVQGDVPALGDGEALALRVPGEFERLGVGHGHVPGVVPQPHGVLGGGGVQGLGGGVLTVQVVLVVALAHDPLAGLGLFRGLPHRLDQLVHRGHGGGAQVQLHEGLAQEAQVAVCVVETGDHGGALQIHGPREQLGAEFVVQAHHLSLVYPHAMGHGMLRVLGVEGAVGEDDVQSHGRRCRPWVSRSSWPAPGPCGRGRRSRVWSHGSDSSSLPARPMSCVRHLLQRTHAM